jgi:hypothetical protein
MFIGAISGMSGVGSIQSGRPAVPAPDPIPAVSPAEPLPSGTPQPLSPSVLAALIGQELAFYGSSYGA